MRFILYIFFVHYIFFSLRTGMCAIIIISYVYNTQRTHIILCTMYLYNIIYIRTGYIIHESFRVPELISCYTAAAAAAERPVIIKHADRVHWLKRGNTNQPPAALPAHPSAPPGHRYICKRSSIILKGRLNLRDSNSFYPWLPLN